MRVRAECWPAEITGKQRESGAAPLNCTMVVSTSTFAHAEQYARTVFCIGKLAAE